MKQETRKKQWMVLIVVFLLSFSFLFVLWNGQEEPVTIGATSIGNLFELNVQEQIEKEVETPSPQPDTKDTETSVDQPPQTSNKDQNITAPAPIEKEEVKAPVTQTVTISIDMQTILSSLDKVSAAVRPYIPTNGIVLASTQVEIKEGDSVYQILERACANNGISLIANNGYVRFIHEVGEFDAGQTSGWLYQVNGVSPSVGANGYKVKANDVIAWRYSVVQGDI